MPKSTLTRREVLQMMGGASVLPLISRFGRSTTREKPDILYIVSDDHAAHALSCYGSRINRTPGMDRLSKEGMRFDNGFVITSLCAPSRATVLTGKYPHLHGQTGNGGTFDGSQQTFPKMLQAAGYEIAVIGKWHLRSEPTGFDHWEVLPGQGRYHSPGFTRNGMGTSYQGYVSDVITDLAVEYMNSRDGERPLFLMVSHKAPHRSWLPPDRYRTLYEGMNFPEPETLFDNHATRSSALKQINMHLSDIPEYSAPPDLAQEDQLRHIYQQFIRQYVRTVKALDENIARLLSYLDERGMTETTLVLYTADNGLYLGDHGWYKKSYMYEQALRVPFLVRYPQEIPAGGSRDEMVLNLDLARTFLDFAGVIPPDSVQGRSIRSLLQGEEVQDWRTAMYYSYPSYGPYNARPNYGLRTGRYKLIRYPSYGGWDEEWELFDLERDPHEMRNLYHRPEYLDIRRAMIHELNRHREEAGQQSPTSVMHEKGSDRMGYLRQNVPNPFNGATTVRFHLPESGPVNLSIYDLSGRTVQILLRKHMDSGEHSVKWTGNTRSGGQAPSGIYYCRLNFSTQQEQITMTYLK